MVFLGRPSIILPEYLDIKPAIVAFDHHPDYLSTEYAKQLNDVTPVAVQHHHAHIVSVMAEHGLSGPVLGLAFDGTGYGTDGHIWGGEVLVVTPGAFERVAHPAYVSMPGSAAAIKEPWRMAVSYLYAAFGDTLGALDIPFLQQVDAKKIQTVIQMITRGINSPQTSSLGRLFDGVAALTGIRRRVTYEGQAAMALEQLANESETPYAYTWDESGDRFLIRFEPMIRDIVSSLTAGVSMATIAGRFHVTLVHLFSELAVRISRTRGIKAVVLSGGVFQNMRLLKGMTEALYAKGLTVYTPISLPANDGGISLGQAIVAAASIECDTGLTIRPNSTI